MKKINMPCQTGKRRKFGEEKNGPFSGEGFSVENFHAGAPLHRDCWSESI